MENVILIIHLLLALGMIVVVLLQRSEGGGLGMGGGGNVMSARGAASALGKLTWLFAILFICTSLALTIIAAQNSASSSVIDRLGVEAPEADGGIALPPLDDLLPPSAEDDPLAPPTVE